MGLFSSKAGNSWTVSEVRDLHWRELEFMIGAALREQGHDVEVTKEAKDGGIDVDTKKLRILRSLLVGGVVFPSKERLVIDAKQWSDPVDRKPIEKMADTAEREGATGVVASPSGFYPSAKSAADEQGVRLYGPDKIVNLFNRTEVSEEDI